MTLQPTTHLRFHAVHFYPTENWNIKFYANARIADRSSPATAKILRHVIHCSGAIHMHAYTCIRRNKLSPDERRQEISVHRKILEIRKKTEEKKEETEREREREKKRRKTVSRRKCNERARANLYQPPEARGRRYGSRTTPDISDG